jgi:hypothetical protein
MVTIRVRSVMWFAAGAVISLALVWSLLAWRVFASPGPGESTIVSVAPARVLDTRDPVNLGLAGPFVSAVSQKLQVTGAVVVSGGATATVVPVGATGVLLNVTVVLPTADGFVSIRPGDASGAATTSSLNFVTGSTVPNAVQVSLPTSGAHAGQIDITFDAYGASGPRTDVLIDVVGYTTNVGIQSLVADIALKADASALAAKANVTSLPIATSARENDVTPNLTFSVPQRFVSTTIVAPVPGLIQIVGSASVVGVSVASRMGCSLTLGSGVTTSSGDLLNTSRTVDINASGVEQCTSVGAVSVGAGTHVLNFVGSGATGIDVGGATINAIFVPNGTISASFTEGGG